MDLTLGRYFGLPPGLLLGSLLAHGRPASRIRRASSWQRTRAGHPIQAQRGVLILPAVTIRPVSRLPDSRILPLPLSADIRRLSNGSQSPFTAQALRMQRRAAPVDVNHVRTRAPRGSIPPVSPPGQRTQAVPGPQRTPALRTADLSFQLHMSAALTQGRRNFEARGVIEDRCERLAWHRRFSHSGRYVPRMPNYFGSDPDPLLP